MTLTSRQKNVAALLGAGHRQVDVAREMKVHVATIARWMHIPDFKNMVSQCEDEAIAKKLRDVRAPAIDLLTRQMYEGKDFLAQQAARDLLTRAGITGTITQQATQVQVIFGSLEVGEAGESRDVKSANITDEAISP